MKIRVLVLGMVLGAGLSAGAQSAEDGSFRLSLPDHAGQISWQAEGFHTVESSAKPNGNEIGLRGKDASGRLTFLGFLFRLNGAVTSAKCRDGVLDANKHDNPAFNFAHSSEIPRAGGIAVEVVDYSLPDRSGKPQYSVRGFVAADELCGDLEFYSNDPIKADDLSMRKAFASFQFAPQYQPAFKDIFFYAQVLFNTHQYAAAGPYFEKALTRLDNSSGFDSRTWTRVATDQAGMAYGMSGNLKQARSVFENAIAHDPDYPLYYYNLACADAEEKNLADARKHLEQAFDRKGNTLPGEKMPDPTQDDSFTPTKGTRNSGGSSKASARGSSTPGTRLSATIPLSAALAGNQLSFRYSKSRMALRRAALISLSPLTPSADAACWRSSSASAALQAGQRLAKPGLPGRNSNSSSQMTQVLMGNGMILRRPRTVLVAGRQRLC